MKPLILIITILQLSQCFRILVVFPFAGKSHSILGDGVVRNLLEAGHKVTYITPYLGKINHSNLTEIDVSDVKDCIPGSWLNLEKMIKKGLEFSSLHHLSKRFHDMDVDIIQHKNVQELLTDPNQNFDVVIIEWLFSEYLSGISSVFQCPYIWVGFYDPHWAIMSLIGEDTNPAYVPTALSSSIPPFSFVERVHELWSQIVHEMFVIKNHYILEYDNDIFKKMYTTIFAAKGRSLPSYTEVRYNASLILGNSHASMGLPISLPQNYKPVGGYYIDSNTKELPKELKTLMDDATHGVIYFSMGTLLSGKDLPEMLKKNLLQMFKELKQTVFWKLEESFGDLPKNVHIFKWAPQQSILAHPNCRLFITHGGMLSTTEAIHFGVPIIGVPMMVDQFNNINKALKRGFSIKLKMSLNLANDLKIAIREILGNSKYAEKAKELSALYHDRPVPPSKELVFWVEHVARTRGAAHLRSPALMVPWYQKIYLDLIVLLLMVLLLSLVLLKELNIFSYIQKSSFVKKKIK